MKDYVKNILVELEKVEFQRMVMKYSMDAAEAYSFLYDTDTFSILESSQSFLDKAELNLLPIYLVEAIKHVFAEIEKELHFSRKKITLLSFWFEDNELLMQLRYMTKDGLSFEIKDSTSFEQFEVNNVFPVLAYAVYNRLEGLVEIGKNISIDAIDTQINAFALGLEQFKFKSEILQEHPIQSYHESFLSHYDYITQPQVTTTDVLDMKSFMKSINELYGTEGLFTEKGKELLLEILAQKVFYTNELIFIIDVMGQVAVKQIFKAFNLNTSFRMFLVYLTAIGAPVNPIYYQPVLETLLLFINCEITLEKFQFSLINYIALSKK